MRAARRNVPTATLALGDARAVDLPDAAAGACVSNLPFGRRFTVHGEPRDWLRAVLVEMTRVTRPGGCVVVLSPSIPALAVPAALRPARTMRIRLLGTWTHLNAYDRT